MANEINLFDMPTMEGICKILGDTDKGLTGSQIGHFLLQVDKIIATKKADLFVDTTELERQVDMLVHKLYGVHEEVIAFVADDEMCVEKINFCNKILKI